MTHPSEFTSEPFDFKQGGILSVEAKSPSAGVLGLVEFRLEGSEDKISWAEITSGSVSDGESVEVPCRDRVAAWGRVRLRTHGGDATASIRGYTVGGP